jgi:hypothetical protein
MLTKIKEVHNSPSAGSKTTHIPFLNLRCMQTKSQQHSRSIDDLLALMMPPILNSSCAASYAAKNTKGKCDIFNFDARS